MNTPIENSSALNKPEIPFYIKKSEKKLTVPAEPRLNTNARATRRESIGKHISFCDKSEGSMRDSKAESEHFYLLNIDTFSFRS